MKTASKSCLLSVVWLLITVVPQPLSAVEPGSAEQARYDASDVILGARRRFNEAIAGHDVAAIPGFLDTPYQITTSTGQLLQSTPEEDAVAWADIFRERPDVIYVRNPYTVEVSDYLDLAAEQGEWVGRWTGPEGPVEVGGSYFAQWRNTGDSWKIRAEAFVRLYCKGSGCQQP